MVLEATGGLARAVTSARAAAGLPVGVVHPRQVRDGARAPGQLATTEAWEARARAHCADVIRPPPRPRPDAQTQALRALLGRRQPLISLRTAEQHRRVGTSARLTQAMAAPIPWRNVGIATLDDALETRLRASPLWREHDDLWPRAKGMGPVWARTLWLALPALGDAHTAAERGLGRRGAPPWRPGDPPRSAHALGRARACAHRVIHGHAGGHPLQPAEQSFFRAAPHRGESQKSRPDRV